MYSNVSCTQNVGSHSIVFVFSMLQYYLTVFPTFLYLTDAEYKALLKSCELHFHPPNMRITYNFHQLKVSFSSFKNFLAERI